MIEGIIATIVMQTMPTAYPISVQNVSMNSTTSSSTSSCCSSTSRRKGSGKKRAMKVTKIQLEHAEPEEAATTEASDLQSWYYQTMQGVLEKMFCCAYPSGQVFQEEPTTKTYVESRTVALSSRAAAAADTASNTSTSSASSSVLRFPSKNIVSPMSTGTSAATDKAKFIFIDDSDDDQFEDFMASTVSTHQTHKNKPSAVFNPPSIKRSINPADSMSMTDTTCSMTSGSTVTMQSWNSLPGRQSSMSFDSGLDTYPSLREGCEIETPMSQAVRKGREANKCVGGYMDERFWTDPAYAEQELIRKVQNESLKELPYLSATEGYRV